MKFLKILISIIITFFIILISYKLSEKIEEIEMLREQKYCLEDIEKSYVYSQNKSCEKILIEATCKNLNKTYVLNNTCQAEYLLNKGWIINNCFKDILDAKNFSKDKICIQIIAKLICPYQNYVYIAKNGCESSYLIEKGWKISEEIV